MDPDKTFGLYQKISYKLNGLIIKAATNSTAVVTFTGIPFTDIAAGFQVSTESGNIFVNDSLVTIGAFGTVDAAVTALIAGSITAEIGQINTIVTQPHEGISSVTNAAAAIVGRNQETQEQFRLRRRLSTEVPASNIADASYSRLRALPNVDDVYIDENDEDDINANGTPGHSFRTIVLGGDNQEIAYTIWGSKPTGILSFGTIEETIIDANNLEKIVRFDRPTEVQIYVKIDTIALVGFPGDGVDRIKAAIVQYALDNYLIGKSVARTRLYTPANSVPSHAIQMLYIGLTPSPSGTSDIPIDFDKVARILTANIEVNLV
jgi:uncharacterized phage protein gp47/JayE